MNRDQKISEILKTTFGFESLRLEQNDAIGSVLDGNDTLVIMPTGGGKSLCYQLPAIYLEGVTVVISPLISLMQDQVDNLNQFGIEACFLNSSQDFDERDEVKRKLLSGAVKLLYLAPEGALNPVTIAFLKQIKVSLIAIDEAHCVSQWGHEFRSDYTRLNELKEVLPGVPTIALTATADGRTQKDICSQLNLKDPKVLISGFDRPNIKYSIYEREDEIKQLNQFILDNHIGETGIVYCLSRKKVERVADELKHLGYRAYPYHAGLTAVKRAKYQKKFKTEEAVIIVATIAFGMGIDRPDVKFVAHLDLPKSIEGYYQETGRAGRDGAPSNAWMVYGFSDVVKLSRMLETTEASDAYKKIARHKLDAMLSLCESTQCRRKSLLNYFGQDADEKCGNCDACLEPQDMWDATVEAQKILSTIYRTGQMFGASHIIDVVRGSQNAKVIARGHDKLSVYGVGKSMSKNDWNSILRQLLTMDYIYIKDWDFRSLALSEKSRPVLKGEQKLSLRKMRSTSKSKSKSKARPKRETLQHDHPKLFEELRALRRDLASENKVPPYIIFGDKSLHDMCSLLPQNKDQMLMVHGVGQSKYDKYGKVFMDAVNQYLSPN